MNWTFRARGEVEARVPDLSLGDKALPRSLATAPVEASLATKAGPLTFVLDAGAEATLESFNDTTDVDALGVVGVAPAAGDVATTTPPLVMDERTAWLKFASTVRVKTDGAIEAPFVALAGSQEASLEVADYRAHAPTEKARAAVSKDGASLRVPFALEHIVALGIGDAVALEARAQLQFSAKLDASDVFTSNVALVTNLLPLATPLALAFTAGGSFEATLTSVDDYVLVFSRERPGALVVTVRKPFARGAKLGLSLGVQAELSGASALAGAVDTVLQGVLGKATIDQLRDAASKVTQGIDPTMKSALVETLTRLGIADLVDQPARVLAYLDDLRTRVEAAVRSLVEAKFTAGFSYEMGRVREGTTLVRFEVDDAALAPLHPLLIQGRLDQVLARVDRSRLRFFLARQADGRTSAWGFSMQLGAWEMMKSRDTVEARWLTERSTPEVAGPRRMAFSGTRRYEGNLFGQKGAWGVDLRADMTTFRRDPDANSFDYGLYLYVERQGVGVGDLERVLDEAVVWSAFDYADKADVLARLAREPAPFTTRSELKVANDAFRALLPLVAAATPAQRALALGRALPWVDDRARKNPAYRALVYQAVFQLYFQERGQGWGGSDAARKTAALLRNASSDALRNVGTAAWEADPARQDSVADVLAKDAQGAGFSASGAYDMWSAAQSGAKRLADAIATGGDPSAIGVAFDAFQRLWGLSYPLKAFGALLVSLSEGAHLEGSVERVLAVTLPQRSKAPAFVLSSSRRS